MDLGGVLAAASEQTVRSILIALCDDVDVRKKVLGYLPKLEPGVVRKAKGLPPPPDTDEKSLKRKATGSALAICVQCKKVFDPDDNQIKECRYHNGQLEPDYGADTWADHDERCHGEINSDFSRSKYPDGLQWSCSEKFLWSCCGKTGTEEGCKLGGHEADPERNKRRRDDYDQSEEDEDEDEWDESDDQEE